MSTRYLFINQVSFVFIFGLHIKKVIFGLCNDIPADSYVCLTTVKARDDKVTELYAFFFFQYNFIFIPNLNLLPDLLSSLWFLMTPLF